MKKFVGLTLAAVCTLTACAFGFSGCSKASDVVTEEEWIAAMSSEKAINVTMKATASMTAKGTYEDETYSNIGTGTIEAKTALSIIDAESSSVVGNVTGNTYYYVYEKVEGSEESYEEAETCYASISADTLTYVYKATETDEEDYWNGFQMNYDDAQIVFSLFMNYDYLAYPSIEYQLTLFADVYDKFEYTDGAYKAEALYNGYDVYIKINDGYLTSIEMKGELSESYDGYSYEYNVSYKYTFSDYGTTTVEIPTEYTYDNYLANHSEN